MEYVITFVIGFSVGLNIALAHNLRKAYKTIKVLSQDDPIFRSLQLKYSLRKENA